MGYHGQLKQMTDVTTPAAAPAAKDGKAAKAKKPDKTADKKPTKAKKPFFGGETITVDIVDEVAEKKRMQRVLRVIQMQIIVILGLTAFIVFASPLFRTVYSYYAVDSTDANRHTIKLLALSAPNMTNQAILSWSANSITEIMTFGFGDYVDHLRKQKNRFTPEGWKSFVLGFSRSKIGQTFKERQLVLTTVPGDQAVIKSQGPNDMLHTYEWKVQMPVIMTYATNDNLTQHSRSIIELTIVRVSPEENPNGIAISDWSLGRG